MSKTPTEKIVELEEKVSCLTEENKKLEQEREATARTTEWLKQQVLDARASYEAEKRGHESLVKLIHSAQEIGDFFPSNENHVQIVHRVFSENKTKQARIECLSIHNQTLEDLLRDSMGIEKQEISTTIDTAALEQAIKALKRKRRP